MVEAQAFGKHSVLQFRAQMARPKVALHPRKRLDISWADLGFGILHCIIPGDCTKSVASVRQWFAPDQPVLVTYGVRASFDLFLKAQGWAEGSEIIMSALTIREMAHIVREHGLVPVPLDVSLDTLAPGVGAFEKAITPKTRALVIAHLFGSRVDMGPFIETARRRQVVVIEDCAQAFTGPDYTGHPETDVAMFSFGPIKTSTCLVGGLVRAKEPALLQRMQNLQKNYPVEKRSEFLRLLLTHVIVKLFTIPTIYGFFYLCCVLLGKDFDTVISAVRNLPPGDEVEETSMVRKQPSVPLMALLGRRLRRFDAKVIENRARLGAEFSRSLPSGILPVGANAKFHTYWVFPVLVNSPERFAAALRTYGFDSTTAASALSVIEPPIGSNIPAPEELRRAYRRLFYLPVYPELSKGARMRLVEALSAIGRKRSHLLLTDARRIYSAYAKAIWQARTVFDIREVLRDACERHVQVSMMGVRHNLGGHAFKDDSVVLDMTAFSRILSLDVAGRTIRVQSGATWDQIQNAISKAGLALKSMQSDNNFTVGGSLSSNAHGRELRCPVLIDSVLALRVMLADGSIVSASRCENIDLFHSVIGGYGLLGIILDVDLALVEDGVYQQSSELIALPELPQYFQEKVLGDNSAHLFIARPSISKGEFLNATIVTKWCAASIGHKDVFRLDRERYVHRDRMLFALSRRYDWGKALRWQAEKYFSEHPRRNGILSRNNAMRPPVAAVKMFDYDAPRDTDTIQEFFIPIPQFVSFMYRVRALVREFDINLLGITIRYVKQTTVSLLPYAQEVGAFAVVLYFNEELSPEGRAKSNSFIQELVRAALQHEGTFYLTYAREVPEDDFRRAYPNIDRFFHQKQRWDPEEIFGSRFLEHYGPLLKPSQAGTAV